MAAIMLSGEKDKYVFSIVERKKALPSVAGFYILVKSDDKYGIRNRDFLAIGYAKNFEQEKSAICDKAKECTHLYLMPDFDRNPEEVLHDIETASFLNQSDKPEETTVTL